MSENGVLILGAVVLVVLGVLYVAWRAYGWRLAWWAVAAPFWLLWRVGRAVAFHSARGAFAGARALTGARRPRVADPERAELVPRGVSVPVRTPGLEGLRHGHHWTQAGIVKAVHKVTIAEAGAGKGQTGANYEIQYQLQHSPENLVVLEVKPNLELSKVVYAYARPQDRIWEYTFQPKDRFSSSYPLISDPRQLRVAAHLLCNEPGSRDPHWNSKASELLPAAAVALSELSEEAERAAARFAGAEHRRAGIVATINEVRDVIADRRKLEELRRVSPLVDNVSDSLKEWGYIRSTAARHLDALSEMRVRRVFAGRPDTPRPSFLGYPAAEAGEAPGRDIVIVRPDEASAGREARYVIAGLDGLIRDAVAAGHAGSDGAPGTKVILDEFASFMDLSNMRRYLDLGRGGRVQLSYYLQGRDQLAAAVGPVEANSIIASTELKCIGATSDVELAEMIAKLSGKRRVEFRGAREGDELLGDWRDEVRHNVEAGEILSQREGEWTIVHHNEVRKVRVPGEHYHHTQAAPPREHRLWGVVDEADYEVPPILGPVSPADDDAGKNGSDPVGRSRYDGDDILDLEGEDDGWIA